MRLLAVLVAMTAVVLAAPLPAAVQGRSPAPNDETGSQSDDYFYYGDYRGIDYADYPEPEQEGV